MCQPQGPETMSVPHLVNQLNTSQPQGLETTSIPYSVNQPVDPSLWDDSVHLISIYGLHKCLETDANNIATSLNRIASFVRNRFQDGKPEKDILHIAGFGYAAWNLISSIYESE